MPPCAPPFAGHAAPDAPGSSVCEDPSQQILNHPLSRLIWVDQPRLVYIYLEHHHQRRTVGTKDIINQSSQNLLADVTFPVNFERLETFEITQFYLFDFELTPVYIFVVQCTSTYRRYVALSKEYAHEIIDLIL